MTGITESWRPVVGHEGSYEVSSLGRVRSVPRLVSGGTRGRVLRTSCDQGGYHTVCLSQDNKRKTRRVHHMVAESFIGPRPEGLDVLHEDDDKDHNGAENLRYGNDSENGFDSVRNGRNARSRRTHCPAQHEYAPENTRWSSRGDGRRFRMCKACHG